MAESSTTTNRYFDNEHYPRRSSRHGDSTIKEAQSLERHSYTFNELDLDKRGPVTEEKKLFVTVCRGKREPVTEAERVQSEYMTRIKRPEHLHTLPGDKPQVEGAEDYTDSDD